MEQLDMTTNPTKCMEVDYTFLHRNSSVGSEQTQIYIRKISTLKNNTWLKITHVLFLK